MSSLKSPPSGKQWGFLQVHAGGNISWLHLISIAAPKYVSSKARLGGGEQQEMFHLIFCTKAISSNSLDSTPASKKKPKSQYHRIFYCRFSFLFFSILFWSQRQPILSELHLSIFQRDLLFLTGSFWKYSCFLFLFSSICTSLATSKNTHIKMS